MEVHLCQLDCAWENRDANLSQVARMAEEAAPPPGSLIVLPELFATGFSFHLEAALEPPDRPTERFLQALAQRWQCCVLAGLATAPGQGSDFARNEALAIGPDGGVKARYWKNHPFTGGEEQLTYPAGTEVSFFAWGGLKVMPAICYDLRFPELFRRGLDQGAEFFVVIASWPDLREDHWVTLLRARAIENQAYVAGVNRAGRDPSFGYPGRSMVVDPHGNIIIDAGPDEKWIRASLDPGAVVEWRKSFPAVRDYLAKGTGMA